MLFLPHIGNSFAPCKSVYVNIILIIINVANGATYACENNAQNKVKGDKNSKSKM